MLPQLSRFSLSIRSLSSVRPSRPALAAGLLVLPGIAFSQGLPTMENPSRGTAAALFRRFRTTAMTTRQSADFAVHGEVKRGNTNTVPKAPLDSDGEAPTARSEFFTW